MIRGKQPALVSDITKPVAVRVNRRIDVKTLGRPLPCSEGGAGYVAIPATNDDPVGFAASGICISSLPLG
jgi:hypothetical protein